MTPPIQSNDPRPVDPQAETAEEVIYQSLRSQSWSEFCGQETVKTSLQLAIRAAKERSEVLDHVLFYGPPGLGKTTLAHLLAKEMGVNIRVTSGPALERSGDIAAILTNLQEGDVLFIDEIHRLNRVVEETIYPAMEDYRIDVILGKGPAARTLRLDVPRFTLVGATTQAGKLSSPLRDRFGLIHKMEFYTDSELASIIAAAAIKLQLTIESSAAEHLASRSRKTARVALKLLKRVRDFAQVQGKSALTTNHVAGALKLLEVDELGLDASDRKLLLTIIDKFAGGPVGLKTLSAATAEDIETIEDVYEPFLIRAGLLKRTTRGRVVTPFACTHVGRDIPKGLEL